MIEGFLTVKKTSSNHRLIKPYRATPEGWGIGPDEIPLGYNTMVDNGRQLLAYLFGGRSPSSQYTCARFGIGTGSSPTSVAYTDLESPVNFYDDGTGTLKATKPINGVDFPVPYVARVEFTIGATEAVGHIITEFGLYTAGTDGVGVTLLCRKTELGFPKQAKVDTFLWRVRF